MLVDSMPLEQPLCQIDSSCRNLHGDAPSLKWLAYTSTLAPRCRSRKGASIPLGVQDQGHPDLRAEMLRVGGDGAQRFCCDLKQQVVEHYLVVVGDGADRCRQGEHQMVVVQRQEVGLPGLEPTACGIRLALRAMPVAAGVVGDGHLRTGVATQ